MSSHSDGYDAEDRETFELAPLLADGDEDNIPHTKPPSKTSLPKLQISVLLTLYLAHAIGSTFRAPFIVELISGLDIAPKEVGYYYGVLDSLYNAGEAIAVFQWGRLSDRIGRKPVLLTCTFGITSTMISFGVSRTYAGLAASRLSEGLMNGNSATVKAILAELAGGDEHKLARVFSLVPMTWGVGAMIGPLLGGSLANPSQRFPGAFSGSLWREHPYLFACLSVAAFGVVGFFAVVFYLDETLSTVETTKDDHIYLPTDGEPEEPLNLRFLPRSTFLTRPLFVALITMACLSFLDASLYATYTLLLGSPIAAGGLDFRPKTIGYILGTAALCHGLVQAFCFPNILKRWGTRTVYAASMTAYIFLYIMMPIMNALARQAGRVTPVVWGLLVLAEVVFFASYSSYGCIYIFVSEASPSRSALGKAYGLSQTVSAVMAAAGPAIATSLVALSLQNNLLGGAFGYICLALMGVVALALTSLLPD